MVSSMTLIASAGSLSAQILRFEKYKKKYLNQQSIKLNRKKSFHAKKITSIFMNDTKTELQNSFGGFEKDASIYEESLAICTCLYRSLSEGKGKIMYQKNKGMI
jgi:hypothetical protein